MNERPVMVYAAGPQDDVSKEVARGWRETLPLLAPAGMVFYSPAHAYVGTSRANFKAVDRMNRLAIAASDGVLVNLSGPGRGFGTIREIEYAVACSKPVAVVGLVESLMSHDFGLFEGPFNEMVPDALTYLLERIAADREPPAILKMLGLAE